jgi:hypothetical protein
VSLGEEWVTNATVPIPFLGETQFLQRNHLEKLTDTPQGRVATIVFGGQYSKEKEQQVNFGLAKATFKKMDIRLVGQCDFDIKSGITVSSETHQTGGIEVAAEQPDAKAAPGGEAPDGAQGPKAMNMKIEMDMVTKQTTRPATEDDLKPTAAVANTKDAKTTEAMAMLGAVRSAENVFKTEKGAYLAVATGNVANEPTANEPGLGLDFSKNTYFDAHGISVGLDPNYGFVGVCDGTLAGNAAPGKADVSTYIIQMRGNGQSRVSTDSGKTFTPWE